MTPIEQLVHISREIGLTPIEHCEGMDGERKVFAFSRPMPESVRSRGCEQDLYYNYWRAGGAIREGFADSGELQEIEFPALPFSETWLNFYRRLFKLRWDGWRSDWHIAALQRKLAKPGAAKVDLDSDLIGPDTDEWDRIEAAGSVAGKKVGEAANQRGFRTYWSHGDSNAWRVILATKTERELASFMAAGAQDDLARELVERVGSVVVLNKGFKFYMELDSEERVNANEGLCFRVRGDGPQGQEFIFDWDGRNLSRA